VDANPRYVALPNYEGPRPSGAIQGRTVWAPTAKPLKPNALDPKLSCSCQEDAAGVASDPAAADVHGCFPPLADSAAATVAAICCQPFRNVDFGLGFAIVARHIQQFATQQKCFGWFSHPALRQPISAGVRGFRLSVSYRSRPIEFPATRAIRAPVLAFLLCRRPPDHRRQ
jgi:hypothetical protein